MARGLPSMTALLGMLALAGYQNRDKIARCSRERVQAVRARKVVLGDC
jgi:hypothetical protein